MRLSIIVPALNEAPGITATLAALAPLRGQGHEVIVVDGGSSDATAALATPLADRVLTSDRGRARQMNAGAALARGELLLFLHADTRLPEGAEAALTSAFAQGAQSLHSARSAQSAKDAKVAKGSKGVLWGRFDVHIEGRSRWLPLVAALMNMRSRLTGIATGDQAIFVRREVFHQIGGYAALPLMEDIELSRRLRALAPPLCLRERVATSGRRWESRGVWRTILSMWRLRWRYWRGESPQALAEVYR